MELTQILPQLFDSLPERPVAHHIEEWFIWAHTLVPLPHLPHPPAAPPHTDSPPLPLTCFPFLQFAMNKMNIISSSVWLLILSLLPYRSAALSPSTPPQLPLFMFLTVLKEPICFLFNPHSIVIRFFCFLFCLVLLCTFSVSMSIFFLPAWPIIRGQIHFTDTPHHQLQLLTAPLSLCVCVRHLPWTLQTLQRYRSINGNVFKTQLCQKSAYRKHLETFHFSCNGAC